MKPVFLGLVALASLTAACATTSNSGDMAGAVPAAQPVHTEAEFQRDREAILAMTGEYDVVFDFREMFALQEGYELADPKVSGAYEVVRVIEDRGDFISLQHFLLVGDEDEPMVIKHWRQDWQYEPARVMDFLGNDDWAMRDVAAADAAGAWSQSVYQVDDSPRYGAVGRWVHDNGISTWEPPVSRRPLPRRDDTTRSDYQAIAAVNRHVITPWGWVHEQDNTKIIIDGNGERPLVREVGVNTYARTDLAHDSAADEYWAATADYWTQVRSWWDMLEATADEFHVEDDADGTLLYGPMLNASMRIAFGTSDTEAAWEETEDLFASQVTVNGAPVDADTYQTAAR
ncbi:DUF6607 family protein [Hyphobacterium marinum]|uniref:DUF6607 family protein n=1 Tax=Hyphobacterium marinum TaxID=3116574 RepID=A0ABU7LXJ9_9PROT|nr:DUF6607 family protein [Hyphobacterium sp. Y6023]MEE2566206.1 DUF6607 family protein [Hyphobacterium sp. Y6023]